MDITIYLPDDLAHRAKAKPRGFISGVLREALEAKFAEEDAMKATLGEARTVTLELTTVEGHPYRGRMTAALIAEDARTGTTLYLRPGGEVVAYRAEDRAYGTVEDPQSDLVDVLPTREYIAAMAALGIVPEVDLDAEPLAIAAPKASAASPAKAKAKGRRLRSVPGDLVVEPSVNLLKRLTGHGDATVDVTLATPAADPDAAPPAGTATPADAPTEPAAEQAPSEPAAEEPAAEEPVEEPAEEPSRPEANSSRA